MLDRLMGFSDEAGDSIDEQIEATKRLGWNAIELRTVNKKQIADLTDEEFENVKQKLKENNIIPVSLGSNIASWAMDIDRPFEEDKDLVIRTAIRAKELGSTFVRIMSYKIITNEDKSVASDQKEEERFSRLRWIVDTLKSYGLTAVHENCFTYGGLSYKHTLKLIENVPSLRLVFDTGNPPIDVDVNTPFPYSYQDSLEFYSAVKPYISHIHIKDADIVNGKEVYFYPGEGKGKVKEIIKDLISSSYSGYLSIEPHMEVVFHDQSAKKASNEERMNNYVEYGKRLEKIIKELT